MDGEFVLGFDELPAGRIRDIQRFLIAVIEQRGMPLHLNCLWNALYYRWDLDAHGYPVEALNIDILDRVELGGSGPALPLGAFAYVPTGTAARDIVGEVVAKFGWHPAVARDDQGLTDVPVELAGALASTARLHERVVVDFDALPGWTDLTATQLRRMRERGVWLDDLGHLVYDANYPSIDAADQDDTSFYLDWLLTHRRAGLLDWAFDLPDGMPLDADELDRAVSATFATLEQLLVATPRLMRWGDYFWVEEAYHRYAGSADSDGDGPLNRHQMQQLTTMVARTYGQPVRYSAVGAEVDAVGLGLVRRDETLGGTGWVAATVAANLWLARQLADQARDGVVETADGPVHVRLDDRWQRGGLWRTEAVNPGELPWYAGLPLDRPLGLGAGVAEPTSVDEVDDGELPLVLLAAEELEELSETEARWNQVLTADDLAAGRLAVPAEVARRLPQGPVAVRLTHWIGPIGLTDVICRSWRTTWRSGSDWLEGIGWPAALPVGIRLFCRLPYAGQTIDIETRRLDVPAHVGDDDVTHEYDAAVFQAAAGRQPRRQQLRQLSAKAAAVLDTVPAAPDGAREVRLATMCDLLFGRGSSQDASCVVDTLRIADLLELDREGPMLVRHGAGKPAVDRRITSLDETSRRELGALVRRDTERMRLRPLAAGEESPSYEVYATERQAAGETGTLPERLPPGYTYEKPKRVQSATNQHPLDLDGYDYYDSKDWS